MDILPGWTDKSMEREMKSPRLSTAQLRKLKPGPRLAPVAGTKVLTEMNMGSGMWVGLEFGIDRLLLQVQRNELSLKVGEIRFNVGGGGGG